MDLSQLPADIALRVPAWKAQYGDLIYVPYGGTVFGYGKVDAFVFRAITLSEYDQIKISLEFDDPNLVDAVSGQVMQACMLWPEGLDLDDLDLADFKALYEKVSSKSPYQSLQAFAEFVDRAREQHSDLKSLVCAFIGAAFPRMSLLEISQLNLRELGQYLIASEHVLQRTFEIPGVRKKRSAPTPPSPDEVRAARHLHAAQRREAAIERAKERRRQRYDQLDQRARATQQALNPENQVYNPNSLNTDQADLTPTLPPSIPTPAALPPPSDPAPSEGQLAGVDRVGDNVPLRRYSDEEILDEQEPMLDADFKREKKNIDRIWNRPEDVRPPDHDGPLVLGA